ncbi:unnamed protein product [Gordionus sp. m RMFG-2023]
MLQIFKNLNRIPLKYLSNAVQCIQKFDGYIPLNDLEINYINSTGPGGQNVNARKTKVQIKFNLQRADWIPMEIKEKIKKKLPNKINQEGHMIITSEKTRYQMLNQADCLNKIRNIIWNMEDPQEIKDDDEEIFRLRHEASVRERLKEKTDRSINKSYRNVGLI